MFLKLYNIKSAIDVRIMLIWTSVIIVNGNYSIRINFTAGIIKQSYIRTILFVGVLTGRNDWLFNGKFKTLLI